MSLLFQTGTVRAKPTSTRIFVQPWNTVLDNAKRLP